MVTEEKQSLIDAVIEDLKKGFEVHDYTVLDELLGFVPTNRLIQSLPEEDWAKYTPPKFVPYIVEDLKVLHNGITEHIRKKYMRIINVVEVVDGTVLGVTSYPILDDQLSKDIVEKAEQHFIKCCNENGRDENDENEDSLIEDGNYRNGEYEVDLTWSDVIL